MRHALTPLLLILFAPMTAPCFAGENAKAEASKAGNWKMSIFEEGNTASFWIITLATENGKTTGKAHPLKGVPATTLDNLKTDGDVIRFTLRVEKGPVFEYEGRLPRAGAKKAFGSLSRDSGMTAVVLEATTASDNFELNRELVARTPNDPRAFAAVFDVIAQASKHKVPTKELRDIVDGSLKAAEAYGPRWQLNYSLRLVEALQKDPATTSLAIEAARKAEKLLDPSVSAETHLRLLTVLAEALKQAKMPDAALEARIAKLEDEAYAAHVKAGVGFAVEKAGQSKGKGDRRVLVELFTGAQCPPCIAADLAFDAVAQAYSSGEVVLLQYHMHIPGPDPLTVPESEARFDFYAETYARAMRGTPSIVFNGKPAAAGGGGRADAEDKFKEYRAVIAKLRETKAGAALSATAVRTGDAIEIQAAVKDLDKVGDKTRLRLVLVEDYARYRGSNGLMFHHRVVRAMPGGVKGFALAKKASEHSAKVDLSALRQAINRALDEPYPEGPRPLRLSRLHVVAFVQDDETTEVLQALDVPVQGE